VFLRFLLLILGRRAGIEPPKHRSEIAAVAPSSMAISVIGFWHVIIKKVREKVCSSQRKTWRREQKGTALKGRKGEAA